MTTMDKISVDEQTRLILKLRPDPRSSVGLTGARSTKFIADKSPYATPGRLAIAIMTYRLRHDLLDMALDPFSKLLSEDLRRRLIIAGKVDEAVDVADVSYSPFFKLEKIETVEGAKPKILTLLAPRLWNSITGQACTGLDLQGWSYRGEGEMQPEVVPDIEYLRSAEYLKKLRELNLAIDRELCYTE